MLGSFWTNLKWFEGTQYSSWIESRLSQASAFQLKILYPSECYLENKCNIITEPGNQKQKNNCLSNSGKTQALLEIPIVEIIRVPLWQINPLVSWLSIILLFWQGEGMVLVCSWLVFALLSFFSSMYILCRIFAFLLISCISYLQDTLESNHWSVLCMRMCYECLQSLVQGFTVAGHISVRK